ncbi:alpha/beta hydrolase [bacterium]|nr:alpha/beta hydrolase [bacterium]
MLIKISPFFSEILDNEREIWVFLPPGYNQRPRRRYPVFYLQDGQRIFSPPAGDGLPQWNIDLTALELMKKKQIRGIIMVGIAHSGGREYEYTPTFDQEEETGGGGDDYLAFVSRELKPFVDEHFRTLSSRSHTAIGGSSLGGLISLYAALGYSHCFGKIAAMSPSLWWDNYVILKFFQAWSPPHLKPVIWLDMGTCEEDRDELTESEDERDDDLTPLEQSEIMTRILMGKGYRRGRNLRSFTGYGASHDEISWGERFDRVLTFLFGQQDR